MKAFLKDSSALNAGLKSGPYQKSALVPPSRWLDNTAPASPRMSVTIADDSTIVVTWSHEDPKDVFRYVVYYQFAGKGWEYSILNSQDRMVAIPNSRFVRERPRGRQRAENIPPNLEYVTRIEVTAVDRLGNESGPSVRSIVRPAAPVVQ